MKKLRISQFPILNKCCGVLDALDSDLNINTSSEISNLGTARHAVAAELVRATTVNPENEDIYYGGQVNVSGIASKYGVDVDDLWTTFNITKGIIHNSIGTHDGKDLPPLGNFLNPHTLRTEEEVSMNLENFSITGHPDLYSYNTLDGEAVDDFLIKELLIVDWKFGYKKDPTHYQPQLMGYANAIILDLCSRDYRFSQDPKITGMVIFPNEPKSERYSTFPMNFNGIVTWSNDLLNRIKTWDGKTYEVGDHCTYCPNKPNCPAFLKMSQNALAVISDKQIDIAKDGVEFWQKLGLMENMIKDAKKVIKEHLIAGNEIKDADGNILTLAKPKDKINSAEAIQFLRDKNYPDYKILEHVKINKSGILSIAAEDAKDNKQPIGKAKELALQTLKSANIITPAEFGSVKLIKK